MYLQYIKLENFKCFSKNKIELCVPDGVTEGSGLNILVGENNSGKSSFFEAFYFIRNKAKNNVRKIGVDESESFFVEQCFSGRVKDSINNFIQDNKKKAFSDMLDVANGKEFFVVRRQFNNDEEVKKILFQNPKTGDFSNPSGIDAPFSKFYQISNIWANTNPEDESRYGASTICGNLLSDISEKFKVEHAPQIQKFIDVFNETFNNDEAGLQSDLNAVARETEQILNDQFGEAKLKFKFEAPEPDIHFKNIRILVNDGEETEIGEKGHGMQRAVILSLLQVYAKRITEVKNSDGEITLKPHFLFIDEPELGLHPQAQKKLFDALKIIAKTNQVFISTHSENFISSELINNVYKFSLDKDGVNIFSGKGLKIDLKENRKFFYHHHKLFFTKRCIFVEGIDDYERYRLFCEQNGFKDLKTDFYLLAGCGDFKVFKDLCEYFNITAYFILDVDVIATTNISLKNISNEFRSDIEKLGKVAPKKDPSLLLDNNLQAGEIELKDSIIHKLFQKDILVLRNGALEQYLNNKGEALDKEKHSELIGLFAQILAKESLDGGIEITNSLNLTATN